MYDAPILNLTKSKWPLKLTLTPGSTSKFQSFRESNATSDTPCSFALYMVYKGANCNSQISINPDDGNTYYTNNGAGNSHIFNKDISSPHFISNGIGDYTIVEGENDLFLYNNNSCKVYKFIVQEVCPEIAPAKRSI